MTTNISAVEQAKQIATKAHKGQNRWDNTPYITHPEAVAASVRTDRAKCVAWLHDVVEDTDVTLHDLVLAGVDKAVVTAVEAITKREGEAYVDYLKRVAANNTATLVKVKDIEHNLSCNMKKGSMMDKYLLAIQYLKVVSVLKIHTSPDFYRKVMEDG